MTIVSPVPLFATGAEAAAHGMRDIAHPGRDAQAKATRLMELRERKARRTS